MYSHILVPLDGSELAESVLPYVQPLVEKFGAKLTLLRATVSAESILSAPIGDAITAEPLIDPTPIVEADRADTRSYLAGVSERLRAGGTSAEVAMPEGDADDAIVEYATSHGVELIALSTHGRSGFERLVYGSVAESVLRHTPCPVLLIRAREGQGNK